MDFEIITQGRRLKELRTKLGLKQEHLSGEDITRNLISMIETDKSPLTAKAAKIVIENLKKYVNATDENILQEIEALTITEEDQAKEIFERFMHYAQSIGVCAENELNTMLEILNKYGFNAEKIRAYHLFGIMFEAEKLYEKSFKYFGLAREFAEMTGTYGEIYGEIILNLQHCCNRLKMVNEGLFISNGINSDIPPHQYARIVYNKAALYKLNKQYDEAIKELDFVKVFNKELKNDNLKVKAKLLQANCYREMKHYNTALVLHKELYNQISKWTKKKIDELYIILSLENIVETAMILQNSYIEYLDKLVEHISNYSKFEDDYTSAEICKFISIAYMKLKENRASQEYLFKALELGKKHKNQDVVEYVATTLVNRAMIIGNEGEVDKVKSEVLELLSLGYIHRNSRIVLSIIEYYIKRNSDKALGIIDYCKTNVS